MANVKVTQDKNVVRWLELMRNGSGTLLEIRDNDEALQIITALQQSVQADELTGCAHRAPRVVGVGLFVCDDCGKTLRR